MTKVEQHRELCMELHETYCRKNQDYGDSFHQTYLEEGAAAVRIRLSDKLNRYKTLSKNRAQQVQNESIRDTLMDLANYALMAVMELDDGQDRREDNRAFDALERPDYYPDSLPNTR